MSTKGATRRNTGFTLIELIVTIVVAALAMAAVIPFLGDVFLRSHEPGVQLHAALELQTAMENLLAGHTGSLGDLYNQVGPEGSYLSDGVRLVEKRYVEFTGAAESEAGAETGLLKIRLENSLGESATRLFTEPL